MSQTEPSIVTNSSVWPALPLDAWRDTYATRHMWTQIVGKIRMALSPHVNHWWQVPLYLTARGLTTSPMPYRDRVFELNFDFVEPALLVLTSDGQTHRLNLHPRSVADFYQELMGVLNGLGFEVKIWPVPVEVLDPIPFAEDTLYDHMRYLPQPDQALLEFWQSTYAAAADLAKWDRAALEARPRPAEPARRKD